MLHHITTILFCYGNHFESKMAAKIQESSDLGKIWFMMLRIDMHCLGVMLWSFRSYHNLFYKKSDKKCFILIFDIMLILFVNFHWNQFHPNRRIVVLRRPFWIQNGHHSKLTMDINSHHHNLFGNQISSKSEDFCILAAIFDSKWLP